MATMSNKSETTPHNRRVSGKGLFGALVLCAVIIVGGAPTAEARMKSTKITRLLCETTGGGKFVKIPGQPGERIDRRLLNDVRYLKRNYKIFITDGFSRDPAHSQNGEHPLGLAMDIVPDFARGGSWNDIDRLARFAERRQNQVRPPFRWVGYDGDAGHGRGHHLHLSYNHSASRPYTPARTISSLRCPGKASGRAAGQEPGGGSGGVSSRSQASPFTLAPVVAETGGIDR